MRVEHSGDANWPASRGGPPLASAPADTVPVGKKVVDEAETVDGAIERWSAAVWGFVSAHRRLSYLALFVGLFGLALWSRYRYVVGEYTYTFGTGDAHLILVKALFLREGILRPPPEMVPAAAVFDQPPLIPILFAGVSRLMSLPLTIAPFVLVPLLTSAALLAFFGLVRRAFDPVTAVVSTGLLALLPRFSFDSTEPEKAPFVVSFAVIALWLLLKSEERPGLLPLAGLFLGLSMFAHTTGYFFLPVFVVSYFGLRGMSRRTLFDRRFLAALAIPAFFVGLYFLLAKLWAPPTATEEAPGAGVLPAFVQTYVDALTNLAGGGITDRAWNRYFEGIRHQLTTPVYVMAIAGLVFAVIVMFRSRRFLMLPVVLWMVIVTLCFAIQYPASSHGSRYPSYVTPAFLALAAFSVVTAYRWVTKRLRPRMLAAPAAAVLVLVAVGLPALNYTTAASPSLRDLYGGHRDLADYLAAQGLLDDGSHILYLGWPSVTLYLLEHDSDYRNQLHSFGFGLRDLGEFTPEFITANGIRYYADNHIADDGFDSAAVVMEQLQARFRLKQLGRFERRPYNHVTLYEIERAVPEYEEALRLYLAQEESAATAGSLTVNPSLRWDAGGSLPGWSPNGRVELEPAEEGEAHGVLVRNSFQFGGIRQLVHGLRLPGRTITAVATLRGSGSHPARSAVISLSREGDPPFSQVFVPLESGENLIVLEAQPPEDIGTLRITVATGREDEGDLVIQHAYLIPGPLEEILDVLQEGAGARGSPSRPGSGRTP